jgi:RimJ/RimL family protein N-acetyltransferase
MPHYRKLVGDKCYLSPLAPEDAERSAGWDNDLEVALPLGDEAWTPTTAEETREGLEEAGRHHSHLFGIVDKASDELIGRCVLFQIDPVNRSAMMGIVIGEKGYWGRGYGREATGLLLDYAFNLLNLNNVMLGTFSFNERALRCYRAVGFREIGRRRQARIVGDRRYDVVFMDILAEELASPVVQAVIC